MNKTILRGSFFAGGMLLAGVALAQTPVVQQTTRQALVATKIARCEVIERNVDKRTANFEKQKTKHITQYEKALKRTTALVAKLEAEGYDVDSLNADLVTFNDLIKRFGEDYTFYISDLVETKEFTCGRSEGEFKAKLAIARAQLKAVHDDSVSIHTFWAQTIKPKLNALKQAAVVPLATETVEGSN